MAESQDGAEPARRKFGTKLLVIVLGTALALSAGAGGAYFFLGGMNQGAGQEEAQDGKSAKRKEQKPKAPAQYVKLDPPFVTNFESKGLVRFLQVTVEVMTRDPVTMDMIKQHDPMIRNDLLMLFSNQQYEVLSSREGKEELRRQALEVVSKVIDNEGGDGKKVEQLYFTTFVMQ